MRGLPIIKDLSNPQKALLISGLTEVGNTGQSALLPIVDQLIWQIDKIVEYTDGWVLVTA